MRLLFVCIENSNRSQMAEAFARIHGDRNMEAWSAGSRPSGRVSPQAVAAMADLGYDLTTHRSTALDAIPEGEWDAVVTMGCGDACPFVPARRREDWDLPDPRDLEPQAYLEVRDEIGRRVSRLIEELDS